MTIFTEKDVNVMPIPGTDHLKITMSNKIWLINNYKQRKQTLKYKI